MFGGRIFCLHRYNITKTRNSMSWKLLKNALKIPKMVQKNDTKNFFFKIYIAYFGFYNPLPRLYIVSIHSWLPFLPFFSPFRLILCLQSVKCSLFFNPVLPPLRGSSSRFLCTKQIKNDQHNMSSGLASIVRKVQNKSSF